MELSVKDYKIAKAKKYFKTTSLFFVVNGINRNSLDWLIIEQGLKTIKFNCYKVSNKTAVKTLNISTYADIGASVKGSTFLIKPPKTKHFLKQTILNTFNSLFFELLIIKFNNRLYSANSLKNSYSLKYKEAKLLLYQFNLVHLKTCYKISK